MSDFAIKASRLSKAFKVPHEKHTTLKQAALNAFRKKTFEEFKALEEISFEVKKGEFFGVIGRNGSGKSTLLKILAGIYVPDSGRVEVNGKLSPFLELGVGFNPQLTGRENIYLGGSVLGLSKKEINKKFNSIVDFSELRDFVDLKLKNYSSGMQVRLAFSLAINVYAELLLMDEVLAVGDSNFQSKCIDEFNRFKEEGKTVVLVTHDISVVQRYCDRAMLLKNGRIAKIGNAEDVTNEYIMQNIADEEKRVDQQEKVLKDADQEQVNEPPKAAKISQVRIVDGTGGEKTIFKTGEPWFVKVNYEAGNRAKYVNIGIGLYREEGGYVFGYNTQMDDFDIDRSKKEITLSIEELPLLTGSYFINVVCFGHDEKNYYDFRSKAARFKVQSLNNKYRGLLNVPHRWE